MTKLLFLITIHHIFITNFIVLSSKLSLDSNGQYSNLLIAIDKTVPQNDYLIDVIKNKFTEASKNLEIATRRSNSAGLSFKTIHILLPNEWNTSSGEVASWQTFDSADIRIDHSKKITDLPSTKQILGCGNPADYTQYTDYYFLHEDTLKTLENKPYTAPPEKMIVHQWAHYRWGVFDEYPNRNKAEQYYSKGKTKVPVRCSQRVKGRFESKSLLFCEPKNPLAFDETCVFIPKLKSWSRGSLMFSPQLPSVTMFCDSNSEEEDLQHNSEAPNHHNSQCKGASVWDVMRRHKDFHQNYTEKVDTVPKFKIVQRMTLSRDIVMVMDISASMKNANMATLKSAATMFLGNNILERTAKLALVTFSRNAKILQNLVSMETDSARQATISRINDLRATGTTNIPSGLEKAFELLGGKMNDPEAYSGNGYIILITDGKDDNGFIPYTLNESIEILQRSTVTVDSISIGKTTDEKLKSFAERTKGKYIMAESDTVSTTMIENLIFTLGSRVKKTERVSMISKGKISSNQPPEVIATIDCYSGENTVFMFTTKVERQVEAIVISPSGLLYSKVNGSSIYSEIIYDKINSISVKIPGIAEAGEWRAQLLSRSSEIRVKRSDQPSSGDSGFVVITQDDNSAPTSPNIRYVSRSQCDNILDVKRGSKCTFAIILTNGPSPITNAIINLTMTSPNGREKSYAMSDSGSESDVTPDDGIYTYTLHGSVFKAAGIYTVQAKIMFKLNLSDTTFTHRIETFDAVRVDNPFSDDQPDNFPPERITMMKTTVIDDEQKLLQLTFKAVGDDGYTDRASHYEFKIDDVILNRTEFHIQANDPGTQENFTLNLDRITKKRNIDSFSISIRAVDKANNKGEWTMGSPVTFLSPLVDETVDNRIIVQPEMICRNIVPPTWNYRCIVKLNASEDGQSITDVNVTMLIIDPRRNKRMVPMYNNGLDNGIYKSSVIGRDFSIEGKYKVWAYVTFYGQKDKSSKLNRKSVKIGTLNCMKDNPPNQIDNFPPDQIEIISVRLLNKLKHTFELKFAAVGDDGDRLRVKNYEIQVNGVQTRLQHSTPSQPGQIESVMFNILDPPNVPNPTLKVKVRAVDHAQNRGIWSNPAIVPFTSYSANQIPPTTKSISLKSNSANQIQTINKTILCIILSIILIPYSSFLKNELLMTITSLQI